LVGSPRHRLEHDRRRRPDRLCDHGGVGARLAHRRSAAQHYEV